MRLLARRPAEAPHWLLLSIQRCDPTAYAKRHLEGVTYGDEFWVNGKKAGVSTASALHQHTFEATEFLLPRQDAETSSLCG